MGNMNAAVDPAQMGKVSHVPSHDMYWCYDNRYVASIKSCVCMTHVIHLCTWRCVYVYVCICMTIVVHWCTWCMCMYVYVWTCRTDVIHSCTWRMYMYVYVWLSSYIYVHDVCICMTMSHISAHIYMHMCTRICAHMYTNVCVYVHVYVHICTRTCAYMYASCRMRCHKYNVVCTHVCVMPHVWMRYVTCVNEGLGKKTAAVDPALMGKVSHVTSTDCNTLPYSYAHELYANYAHDDICMMCTYI